MKKEVTRQLESYFEVLASGGVSEIKNTKKEIEKLCHSKPRFLKGTGDFVLKIIKDFDNIKNNVNKAAVISGLNLFVLYLNEEYFDGLSIFILKCMENEDGRIRESARHISSWFRMLDWREPDIYSSYNSRNQTEERKKQIRQNREKFLAFIDKIELLMKKYAPIEKPSYIGDSPSGIYKSLVLLWHDMSYGTSRDYEHREYLMDMENEQHIPFMGNDEDDEDVDTEEVKENIWASNKDGDPKEAGKWLKRLSEIAEKRFGNELIRLKFTDEEIGKILATLRIFGQEAGPNILGDLIPRAIQRGVIRELSDANNLVRGMQAFANHVVMQNKNGPVSRLLEQAIIERECCQRGKPDNLEIFVKLICGSHEAIDEFFRLHEKELEKNDERMLKFFKELSDTPEEENKYILEYEEKDKVDRKERYFAKSVAHHILDWYIQADPCGFDRIKEPRKVAAQILAVVEEYNINVTDGEVFIDYDKKDLSKFGGWKGQESFSTIKYKIIRPLLNLVGDRDLLLIDPNKIKVKSVKNYLRMI